MICQENIPKIMKEKALWCVWCFDKSKSKLPFNAGTLNAGTLNAGTVHMAKTNDKETFTNFQTAYTCYQDWNFDGLGMGIFDGFCAIDIDHCIEDDVPSDMAQDIINEMDSYTEISPSGEGIRIIFKVDNFQYDKNRYYIMNHKLGLEIYVQGVTSKYVTITGNTLGNNEVITVTESLQRILDRYMLKDIPAVESNPNISSDSDDAFQYLTIGLQKDKKLIEYWNGYRDEKKSESQNDLGFMSKLMYWCNNDKEKVMQVFCESPYAKEKDESHTKKMEREDYMQNTVNYAYSERTAVQDYAEKYQQHTAGEESKKSITNQYHSPLISATELQQMDLPPIKYLVEDILPEGTCILVAPPKIGKSWFVLDMGLSIAAGKKFLGKQTHAIGVLYFALEDSNRRLQDRMNKVIGNTSPPPKFYFQTKAPTLDNRELLSLLENYVEEYDIKLIIIDTLQKIRRQRESSGSSYQRDYQDMGEIKQFADEHKLSIFLVHHTRKMKDDDPYNMISGTNGIMGAADTAFVITKNKRSDEDAVMNITGRDVEQNDFVIRFDKDCFRWRMAGTLDEINVQVEKSQYESNPIVLTICYLLKHNENHQWTGTASEIINEAHKIGITIPHTPQQIGSELGNLSSSLFRQNKIIYKPRSNGNAGKIHHFEYYNLPDYTPKIDNVVDDDMISDEDDEECIF